MYITQIACGKGKKYKVFGDETFLFSLYKNELKHYGIVENVEIEDSVIEGIRNERVLKRAKERALYLLEKKPFSTSMMRDKLYYNEYPEDIIDKVILFLEEYHYLDDEKYIRMYVEAYSSKKSRKQITYDLLKKGLSRELIDHYFENFEYSEQECFKRQFERYIKGKNLEDWEVRRKIFRYFYGKGFSTSLIETYLK